MATYSFSALADGQAIGFFPASDVLFFDQTAISGGDIRVTAEGSHSRVTVISGSLAGKDVLLQNTTPLQLATSNVSFANGSALLFGDNAVTQNDNANNSLSGTGFGDLISGFGGNDSLVGNAGNDVMAGGEGNDTVRGNDANDWLESGAGNDTVAGGSGRDTIMFREFGAANADMLTDFSSNWDFLRLDAGAFANLGAAGRFASGDVRFWSAAGATSGHDADDRIIFNTTTRQLFYDADGSGAGASQLIATLQTGATVVATDITVEAPVTTPPPAPPPSGINGTPGDDSLTGTPGDDTINGLGGNDTLTGLGGSDALNGGDGNDLLDGRNHRFAEWDPDAETLNGGLGNDTFHVDNPGDVLADAGGSDTLVVHNMDWTLADGFENLVINNGQIETRVRGVGNALDNVLDGRSTQVLETGGDGWHVDLDGQAGNDTLLGSVQDDILSGGAGNDWIDGGQDFDSLDGGLGDDTLYGGIFSGFDTMTGGGGVDHFLFDGDGRDIVTDFVAGGDKVRLDGTLFAGVGASGNYAAGDERFYASAGATAAHDATDRFIYNTTTGDAYYDEDGTGSAAPIIIATLQSIPALAATDIEVINGSAPPPPGGINGTAGNDSLVGTTGNDTIDGLAGNDTLWGDAGNDTVLGGGGNDTIGGNAGDDWVEGGAGNDRVSGGGGRDSFVFRDAPSAANADTLTDFSGNNWDRLLLDNSVMAAIGGDGRFVTGDARFWAAAGASAGHDANDRVVYNTSTGQLYYDADGSGAGAAQLIATLQAGATVVAADITVI